MSTTPQLHPHFLSHPNNLTGSLLPWQSTPPWPSTPLYLGTATPRAPNKCSTPSTLPPVLSPLPVSHSPQSVHGIYANCHQPLGPPAYRAHVNTTRAPWGRGASARVTVRPGERFRVKIIHRVFQGQHRPGNCKTCQTRDNT